jgi:hypothetical protein
MRPTGMRTLSPLVVAAAVVLAAACGHPASPSTPADHPSGTEGSAPAPAVSAPAAPTGPVPSGTPPPYSRPATPGRQTKPTASTSDPDMPRDLVGPPLVLTGTVHVGSRCVVLEVRGHRWALTGPLVATLADGATVTVRGRSTRLAAGCDAERALSVRSVA